MYANMFRLYNKRGHRDLKSAKGLRLCFKNSSKTSDLLKLQVQGVLGLNENEKLYCQHVKFGYIK